MPNKHQIAEPVYQKIALDLAKKIAEDVYTPGEKLYGRSVLAAQYAVSPETIRRALFILKDLGIVSVTGGSGAVVASKEAAERLAHRFQHFSDVNSVKENIEQLAAQQQKQQNELLENVHKLLHQIEVFRLNAPILPYEIKITKECRFLGKMISEINFWQNTGVTVVAIRKKNELIISPGPYALFEEGDCFILVGKEGSYNTVRDYLYQK